MTPVPPRPAIPPELELPTPGLSLLLRIVGEGVQIYERSGDAPGAWALRGPEARLLGEGDAVIGHHAAGPRWELDDGSRVVGRVLAKAPPDAPGAIPHLLLEVTENAGRGALAGARYILRLETSGGLAPEGQTPGGEVRVPYRATYYFWG